MAVTRPHKITWVLDHHNLKRQGSHHFVSGFQSQKPTDFPERKGRISVEMIRHNNIFGYVQLRELQLVLSLRFKSQRKMVTKNGCFKEKGITTWYILSWWILLGALVIPLISQLEFVTSLPTRCRSMELLEMSVCGIHEACQNVGMSTGVPG